MTKAEAQTVYRIHKRQDATDLQLEQIKKDCAAIRRQMINMVLINRRLTAEKATLMESIALLTIRRQGLPIANEPAIGVLRPIGHGG